jgi:iron complex outermembrane receptor protein
MTRIVRRSDVRDLACAISPTVTVTEAVRKAIRKTFGGSTWLLSTAALCVGAAPAALAQGPDKPNDQTVPQALQEVVVSGYRKSIEASLDAKRMADATVDVITAQDIGKFPDKNVADALQRVPGVIISRDGGEGDKVSIRGLSSELTLTELNGNYIASIDGSDNYEPSRSFNYTLLPSNMISRVEVFKTSEARNDEGGVGGTVILHTRRPLEMDSLSGFLSAEGTDADTTRHVDPQISGLLSWKDPSETYGLLVGATYQKRENRSMQGSTESWRWWPNNSSVATDVHHNPYPSSDAISYWYESAVVDQSGKTYSGYWAPQSVDATVVDQERVRTGIQATGQWKPNNEVTLTANYFHFKLSNNQIQNTLKIPEWGYYNGLFKSATLDPSNTVLTSASFQVPSGGCSLNTPPCTMETPQLSGQYTRERSVSDTFDLEFEYHGEGFDADVKGGKTTASGGPSLQFRMSAKPRFTSATAALNGNQLSTWSTAGGDLSMEFSPDIQQNIRNGLAQIDLGSTDSSYTNSKVQQTYFQLDFTKHLNGFVPTINFGAKYRSGLEHRQTGNTYWYSDAATQTQYQSGDPNAAVAQPGFFLSEPLSNIPGGIHTNIFPAINFPAYVNYLNATYGPAVPHPETDFVYDVGEDIYAGYIQANFKVDRLRGNVGVRVARTEQYGQSNDRLTYHWLYTAWGNATDADGDQHCTPDPATGICAPLPVNLQETDVNQINREDKTYTDVLPSLNAAYDLTSDLLLRGAISKVISRPGYADLGSQQRLDYYSPAWAAQRSAFGDREGWQGSGGNKELKPYAAWQFDLGIEWYFRPGSVLGTGLFRKNVSSFIVPLIIDASRPIGTSSVQGTTAAGAVPTPPGPIPPAFPAVALVSPYQTSANGTNAVSQGVEVYAQHTLSFGLGFQANFTYNSTSMTDVTLDGQKVGSSPLVGSARTQVNGSVFYENRLMLLRASYNRRGELVNGIVSGLNAYSDPYQQVDLNASWYVLKDLSINGSVINLTRSVDRQHLGNDTTARYYSSNYSGRIFFLGANFKF